MIRILFFILLVALIGFGLAAVADMPGLVEITVGDQLISIPLLVAAVAVVAVVATVMLGWWLVRVLLTSPQRMQRFFRARRRDRGYQSLSTGIIAAGAGDAAISRKMLKQAGGLLNASSEPLIQLLDAQTFLLEGKHDEARSKFEGMLGDPELRLLAMRGLYMEAQRLGDRDAQRHYAEKAAELAPQLSWAMRAAIDNKTAAGDWDGAIRLLDKQKATHQIERKDADRKRAVLLTALALESTERDPARAKQAALEAHRLAPSFAPAAVAAAEACFRLNEQRRGVKVLETTWRREVHPEVALAYVNSRPGDSSLDRLKKARRLESLRPNTTESAMIVAQTAMEASEFEQARKAVAIVLRNEPRESAFMLMADIEDRETGDQGKVREWLSRAVRAPRDPAWTADGYTSERWAPFSPVTGQIDAFEWKVPVERLGSMIENDLDPMVPGVTPVLTSLVVPQSGKKPEVMEIPQAPIEHDEPEADVAEADIVDADQPAPETIVAAEPEPVSPKKPDVASSAPASSAPPAPVSVPASTPAPMMAAFVQTPVAAPEAEPVLPAHLPDDPGVDPTDPDNEIEKPRRFRLF